MLIQGHKKPAQQGQRRNLPFCCVAPICCTVAACSSTPAITPACCACKSKESSHVVSISLAAAQITPASSWQKHVSQHGLSGASHMIDHCLPLPPRPSKRPPLPPLPPGKPGAARRASTPLLRCWSASFFRCSSTYRHKKAVQLVTSPLQQDLAGGN